MRDTRLSASFAGESTSFEISREVVSKGNTVVVAGWSRDPSEVGTTATSLRTLAEQPEAGRWLLGMTAAGFVAYGFYEIIRSRYLHIRRVR